MHLKPVGVRLGRESGGDVFQQAARSFQPRVRDSIVPLLVHPFGIPFVGASKPQSAGHRMT